MNWEHIGMVCREIRRAVLIFSILIAGLAVCALPGHSQQSHTDDAIRKKAIQLFLQNRFEEALPLLQEWTADHPGDMVTQEELGGCLLAHAVNLPDVEERRRIRLRARQAFLRAKELGDNSNYLIIELAGIPEDGADVRYSDRKEVDDAMRVAEAAFGHGDFPGAIAGYAAVLKLDPNNYEATLFTGDVYFKEKDFDTASVWFERAVRINADRETGYRYWGDALFSSGKDALAKDKYIQGIVAEPYTKAAWIGLLQWAQRNHMTLANPRIQSPNTLLSGPAGQSHITIDASTLGKKDGTEKWFAYEAVRINWQNKKFKEQFPQEKQYRRSLAEESDALGVVADAVSQGLSTKEIKTKDLNSDLATLIKLKQEGLLEPYILISRADQGIAQDYPGYRKDHRDQLIAYLNGYVLHPAK